MLPTLLQECSEFLILANGETLIKNLPKSTNGFAKIKVRKKKNIKLNFIDSFNGAFSSHNNLLNRSVLANTTSAFIESHEPFYIFPINGFKFIYNPEVSNIMQYYSDIYQKISAWLGTSDVDKVFPDVIKNHFTNNNLHIGIKSNAEIIIYNIPYYYAIRKSLVDDYKKFIYDV